jgi:alpha-galactosidase
MLFPPADRDLGPVTRLALDTDTNAGRLPVARWAGVTDTSDATSLLGLLGENRGTPLLVEHAHGAFERPGLRGHRLAAAPGGGPRDVAGRAWSTAFRPGRVEQSSTAVVLEAEDATAGLALRTEVEALTGGALRARHTLTNTAGAPYLLDGLEVTFPLPSGTAEILDFTGRHEGERAPQRHQVADGTWLRESRRGKPGLDGASVLAAGTAGFGFGHGEVLTISVAGSANSVIAVQRSGAAAATVSAGEFLLPGELVLMEGESYTSPWVVVAASSAGLDPAAYALHSWQRSLPAHPAEQPVTLNVWEAVYFDHDQERLERLAELGARVGVERFVLDDGWFHGRRDDTAGLGDWWVDDTVWPKGLGGLVDRVHELGMQFGLWFEPEMVNPDSELYRNHPDWILSAEGRVPLQHRNQLVLDLTNPDVWTYVRDGVDSILAEYPIDYVKWDHNRDLLEAGSAQHGGAPAAHAQGEAYYALLDDLRSRHPAVHWESCAAGGGRIDLGVIERVQRFWTSDMTDALARQQIQRWTVQYIAPEYLGAHVSAPTSHQTGRAFPLNFRAATAFFLAFGIEWDLTTASEDDLNRLGEWCELHKRFRPLLHAGRTVRIPVDDPAQQAHGVVAADGGSAIVCHVQLDDSTHNRGCAVRVPGLEPDATYRLSWLGPVDHTAQSMSVALPAVGPTGGATASGRDLERIGFWMPRRAPHTATLVQVERVAAT